jgi:hypothetical protein
MNATYSLMMELSPIKVTSMGIGAHRTDYRHSFSAGGRAWGTKTTGFDYKMKIPYGRQRARLVFS